MKIPRIFIPEKDLSEKIASLEIKNEGKIRSLKDLILGEDSGFHSTKRDTVYHPEENYPSYPSVVDSVYVNYGEPPVVCIFKFENKNILVQNIPSMTEYANEFNARSGLSKNCVLVKDEYAVFVYGDYPARTQLINAYKEKFEFEEILVCKDPELCPDKV